MKIYKSLGTPRGPQGTCFRTWSGQRSQGSKTVSLDVTKSGPVATSAPEARSPLSLWVAIGTEFGTWSSESSRGSKADHFGYILVMKSGPRAIRFQNCVVFVQQNNYPLSEQQGHVFLLMLTWCVVVGCAPAVPGSVVLRFWLVCSQPRVAGVAPASAVDATCYTKLQEVVIHYQEV